MGSGEPHLFLQVIEMKKWKVYKETFDDGSVSYYPGTDDGDVIMFGCPPMVGKLSWDVRMPKRIERGLGITFKQKVIRAKRKAQKACDRKNRWL